MPVDGGTEVTHTEAFLFKSAPVRWLAGQWLGRWLTEQMPSEMAALKDRIEADARAGTSSRSKP